jgi:hypothetical protein
VDPELQTRVAVRVIAGSPNASQTEGPISLPTCPELISGDFLARSEVSRPALVPNEHPERRPTPRFPGRLFAVITGVLALLASLGLWISSAIRH